MNIPEIKNSEVVVFKPKGGQAEFQVVLDGDHDTVWATEPQIMDLFGKARRTIGEHINNIYEEGELDKESTWREFRQVQKEGDREVSRKVSLYNLDVKRYTTSGEFSRCMTAPIGARLHLRKRMPACGSKSTRYFPFNKRRFFKLVLSAF